MSETFQDSVLVEATSSSLLQPSQVVFLDAVNNELMLGIRPTYTIVVGSPPPPPFQFNIRLEGSHGNLRLGGNNNTDGDIYLFGSKDDINDSNTAAIHLSGNSSFIRLGANGQQTVKVDGRYGNLILGGSGQDGDLIVNDDSGQQTIRLDGQYGNAILGGNGQDGDLFVRDQHGADTIRLDGNSGDIQLLNADCAEEFEVAADETAAPGTVVEIRPGRQVAPSRSVYNQRVVGVVSGAGDYKPALVLDRQPGNGRSRVPVALMGKVFCRVDANSGPIVAGDLLTTSALPGHAMKATDRCRALGAIIGKALDDLPTGQGLIPILVALQ